MRVALATTTLVFALDQLSKFYVLSVLELDRRLAIDVLPPLFNLRMAWNRGVNFGLFAHDAEVMRWIFVAIAAVISVLVWIWVRRNDRRPVVQVSLGLLVGGAAGNAVDRVLHGAVADFINMSCCGIENPYAFNIADVTIFAGAVGLVLFAGRQKTP